MNIITVLSVILLLSVSFSGAVKDEHELDDDIVYDFIVVGSGASGSVVAGRLAQETNKKILLLEGGAKGTGQRDVGGTDYVLSDFVNDPETGEQELGLPWTRYDIPILADSIRIASPVLKNIWNITFNGPSFTQAKVVGGNQATNGMAWLFPQNIDFDNWGIPGYESSVMRPYLERVENATKLGFGGSNRGSSGPTAVEFPSFVPEEISRFVNACLAAGYSIGGDMNSGNITRAIYQNQQNQKSGIRQSASLVYLAKVLGKNNFTFKKSATVTRVLFDHHNNATGVEFVNKHGKTKKAKASIEVILAAGDLQIPKILYNSGIGPASILDAFGIPHRVVNELIGQTTRNHQRASLTYNDPTLRNANFYSLSASSVQFASSRTGVIDRGGVTISTSVDPTSPYPELLINAGGLAGSTVPNPYAQSLSVTVSLALNKYANGTLNLTSSDPLAPTVYTTNAFIIDDDVIHVAKGFLEARRIMAQWIGNATEVSPGPSYATVEDLVPWIRANAQTTCHYYSSTSMGTDSSAPVDTRFLLRGVQKLRIVGPSVVPGPVFLGMQALALALGEKGTDMILQDHNL